MAGFFSAGFSLTTRRQLVQERSRNESERENKQVYALFFFGEEKQKDFGHDPHFHCFLLALVDAAQ